MGTHEDRPLHAACVRHQSVSKGDCGGCGEGVFAGEPAVRLAGGELLHTRCFVCKECGKPFAQGEKYVLIEGAHLHATCSPNAVPCSVCGQKILEDHVKLGSAHYHHRCCKCDKCGRPTTTWSCSPTRSITLASALPALPATNSKYTR